MYSYCSKCYSHRCYEPYREHLLWKHGCSTECFRIESPPLGIPKPEIKACLGVWCEGDTHHVKVNVSESFKLGSTMRVDEDVTYTIEEFFQKDFIRSKMYEETVKTIDRRCRSVPVESTTSASILEPASLHARTNPVQSPCIRLINWLGSCISSVQRKTSRGNFPAWDQELAFRRASLHSSEEAIVSDPSHHSDTDISTGISTDTNTDRRCGGLNGSMRHHMSTASPSAASDDMLPPSQTTPNHTAALAEEITGLISVGSFHASPEEFYGHEVVVLTRSDHVSFLERADLGPLVKSERLASQLQNLVGNPLYHQLLRPQGKRIVVEDPAHCIVLSDVILQLSIGDSIPLEQCYPVLKARIHSILCL